MCTFGASQVVLVIKKPPTNAGHVRDVGSIPGLGRSPGGRHGNLLQYSCLENPMDFRVRPVAKSQTRPSDFHFHCIGNCWFGLDPLLDLVLGG